MVKLLIDSKTKLERKTRIIKNSTDPEYAQQFEIDIQYNKSGPFPNLKVEIIDDNLLKNDVEGTGYIDLEKVISQPNQWVIDGYLVMDGAE